MRNAAGLLLASGIVVAAPAFALALWMPSSFCSKMALLALTFFTVLVLALALALTQFFGVFVDNLMCGADRAADASRAAANATAACAEILSSPPRSPTLQHSISATAPSLS